MASFVTNTVLNESMRQFKSNQNDQKQKIDWNDFNYPPLIKVIHYNIEEVQPEYRLVVRSLWLSSILIVAYTLLNIIDNSIQAGNGIDGIRILYSFMFLFSFNPIQLQHIFHSQSFIFYRGYKGVVSDPYLLVLYKWVQIVLILCWITFSIVAILGFNGFIILQFLFEFLPFCGVLALFEDIIMLIIVFLSGFALFRIWNIKE
ncbi:unnamed protein product (macronuclear) [Paramecium tetraurelia]|uniref:Uncharacterized protein n=1 Tax=Paramecium tetraurelia TaxID=5888 RepID=A0E9X3_PARTE|nr:uncharacterized protein GSPATT00024821001 [Paramecium tetraurelia]CAK92090.1 unnamed protein product [Paramecium tetraurelia]|eukprot:XP_001459487.1 hypothetical protein (macronuclear) [Paramecium tetraurelia strain d4-2]